MCLTLEAFGMHVFKNVCHIYRYYKNIAESQLALIVAAVFVAVK